MVKKGKNQTIDVDGRQVISKVLELTLKYPGLPVTFIRQDGVLRIGVLNIYVENEDWYQLPVPVETFVEKD